MSNGRIPESQAVEGAIFVMPIQMTRVKVRRTPRAMRKETGKKKQIMDGRGKRKVTEDRKGMWKATEEGKGKEKGNWNGEGNGIVKPIPGVDSSPSGGWAAGSKGNGIPSTN